METTRQIAEWRLALNKKLMERELAARQIEQEKAKLKEAKKAVEDTITAQKALQELAQRVQQKAHKQISKVVSRCLSAVFHEPYELRIEFEQKRGKTEARFTYLRNGHKVDPQVDSGGVMEVASLALRLAALVLEVPSARRLLVLDEAFGALDRENAPRVAALLEALAEDLDVQIILSTHSETFEVGQIIRL